MPYKCNPIEEAISRLLHPQPARVIPSGRGASLGAQQHCQLAAHYGGKALAALIELSCKRR